MIHIAPKSVRTEPRLNHLLSRVKTLNLTLFSTPVFITVQRGSIASYASAGIARAEMSVRLSVSIFVRLSVCPSVWCCIKINKASVMISQLSAGYCHFGW